MGQRKRQPGEPLPDKRLSSSVCRHLIRLLFLSLAYINFVFLLCSMCGIIWTSAFGVTHAKKRHVALPPQSVSVAQQLTLGWDGGHMVRLFSPPTSLLQLIICIQMDLLEAKGSLHCEGQFVFILTKFGEGGYYNLSSKANNKHDKVDLKNVYLVQWNRVSKSS